MKEFFAVTANAKYEVFIKGETIDLVIPNERAIDEDGWHSWFNDQEKTKYLEHGLFPTTKEQQRERLQKINDNPKDALVLLVLPKNADKVIGVASISRINWHFRSGHFGIMMGSSERFEGAIFHGMEAKARMVEHAFEVMGLERVWGQQALDLQSWQHVQVLFGFRPEGLARQAFRRGRKSSDLLLSACLLEDYLRIKELRNGDYWPGSQRLLELMRKLPKRSLVGDVAKAIDGAVRKYMKEVELV